MGGVMFRIVGNFDPKVLPETYQREIECPYCKNKNPIRMHRFSKKFFRWSCCWCKEEIAIYPFTENGGPMRALKPEEVEGYKAKEAEIEAIIQLSSKELSAEKLPGLLKEFSGAINAAMKKQQERADDIIRKALS